jgi:electron transport complex protein RnfG
MTDHQHVHASTSAVAPGSSTPAWRLVTTLALGGAVAGALVAYVYQATLPAIQQFADARIAGAVNEVLAAPTRLDTLYLVGDKLSRTPPKGVELRQVTKAFVGYDEAGARVGVAVEASEPGFADEVKLMIGFNPATSALTGYAVLGQKETPGLGSKVEQDTAFGAQFRGKVAPLLGSKTGALDPSTVQTITGATISSRAVIKIINNAVALWQPRLAAFDSEATK